MKAKITHMWGDWPVYYVNSRDEVRDDADRCAYDAFVIVGQTIQQGKILVEKHPDNHRSLYPPRWGKARF